MPRPATLPPASTASARAARAAFFCDLCQKGYSRMNEFEAHESSYDHQHKKRLMEMKQMQRQVKDSLPRKEEKGPLMSIKLGGAKDKDASSGGGFKKGGFKKMNAFAPIEGTRPDNEVESETPNEEVKVKIEEEYDSDLTDEDDYYDPHRPTECHPGCSGANMR